MQEVYKKNRNDVLDVLKGIMIIAVVIGHITATLSRVDLDDNFLYLFCYSWHMFCFMILVGYIGGKYGNLEKNNATIKRVFRLLVPYLVWTVLRSIYHDGLSIERIFTRIFTTPLYWFLIAQFIYELIIIIGKKINHEFIVIFCSLVLIGGGYLGLRTELFRQLLLHYPYYILGYLISRVNCRKVLDKGYIYLSIPLFFCSLLFYSYKNSSRPDAFVQSIMDSLKISSNLTDGLISLLHKVGWKIYNYLIVALLGSLCFYCISIFITKQTNLTKKVLIYLGKRTLSIYVISGFCYITNLSYSYNWVLSLVLCFSVPIIVENLLIRNALTRKVFLGLK